MCTGCIASIKSCIRDGKGERCRLRERKTGIVEKTTRNETGERMGYLWKCWTDRQTQFDCRGSVPTRKTESVCNVL